MENRKRVVVIGLDGLTFDLLLPWSEKGYLPNIEILLKQGSSGILNSTIPALTAPAWASFMTGNLPGNMGVFGFVHMTPFTYNLDCVNGERINSEKIWQRLNKFGKKTGILFVPLTYPAERLYGFMVSGFPAPSYHSKKSIYPENFLEKYNAKIGLISRVVEIPYHNYGKFFKINIEKLREKARLALQAMKNEEWDFFMFHLFEPDTISHGMWRFMDESCASSRQSDRRYKDAILRIYQECDKVVGAVISQMHQEDTLILISDHGFGPTPKRININKWLEKTGLLKFQELTFDKLVANIIEKISLKLNVFFLKKIPSAIGNLVNLIYRFSGVFFRRIIDVCFLKIVYSLPKRLRMAILPFHFLLIDWKNTKAFNLGPNGGIFINLKSRYPQGIVEMQDCEKLLSFIVEGLKALKDEKGSQIFKEIYRKKDIYYGRYTEQAPDLIPANSEGYHFIFDFDDKQVVSVPYSYVSGNHHQEGIFIIKGPNIREGMRIDRILSIADIAPTVYYIMGIPLPSEIDGEVIADCFKQHIFAK